VRFVTVSLVAALAGCASDTTVVVRDPRPPQLAATLDDVHRAPRFTPTDPTDADGDGIPDQLEDYLISQFAPEVHLPPDHVDWTRPANVDWYLPLVRMRFTHRMCRDHEVLKAGEVTPDSIWQQQHPITSMFCTHTSKLSRSDAGPNGERNRGFFLKVANRSTYRGIPVARSNEWRVYAHVKPSSYVRASDHLAAAYDIQIWFFYAYNIGTAGFNHEADWEHVTVSVSADLEIVSMYFAEHSGGVRVDHSSQLRWADATHPIVYAARGTHASYPAAGAHITRALTDRAYEGGPHWQTWKNFVNLGERGRILNNQTWARYDGLWGQNGWFEITSGPVGPMFNRRWGIEGSEYPLPTVAKHR
jgi:hypothetical protein